MFRLRFSALGSLRHEFDPLLGGFLNGFPAVEQRKILSRAPHRRQITIMWAVRVSRLAGVIHGSRVIPISDVDNQACRRPTRLTEIAGPISRGIHGILSAVFRNGADVDPRSSLIVDDGRKRMFGDVV